jgi:hypothetical protein
VAYVALFAGTFLISVEDNARVPVAAAADIACGSFFDKWEEPGIPPDLLGALGLGHELAAAQDCLAKQDVATACKNWSTVLAVTDKLDLPLEANRAGLEQMMQEHQCETAPAGTPSEDAAQ